MYFNNTLERSDVFLDKVSSNSWLNLSNFRTTGPRGIPSAGLCNSSPF